ncbi:MAG: hypothetical protein OXF54_01620 [Caldilineaceae bacterium]|nr:hypothetical protein [Caldilineaceae bacterium]
MGERVLLVGEAKLAAEKWVQREGIRLPGLEGAFITGSVTTLPDEKLLPASSDVDVTVVLTHPPTRKPGKFSYCGVLLEVTFEAPQRIFSAETVLGDPHLAGGTWVMKIVADPSGRLKRLQREVAGRYAYRQWVRRRCRAAAATASARLQSLDRSAALHERVTAWLFGTSLTALILLLAGLRAPTVRRRYVEVRDLLFEHGRPGFHEQLLHLLGCADWGQSQASEHLEAVASAFERAKSLPKGDFPYAGDISAAARSVAIGGSRELIEQGLHREAVFWIVATYSRCQWILDFNCCDDVGDGLQQGYLSMLNDLGITSAADLEARCKQVLAFLPRVMEVAEAVMDTTAEIEQGNQM